MTSDTTPDSLGPCAASKGSLRAVLLARRCCDGYFQWSAKRNNATKATAKIGVGWNDCGADDAGLFSEKFNDFRFVGAHLVTADPWSWHGVFASGIVRDDGDQALTNRPWLNSRLDFEDRAQALLAQMSLAEKIGQMWQVNGIGGEPTGMSTNSSLPAGCTI